MSRFEGFPDEAFAFFEGLEADNSKPYWTDHRHVYEQAVRGPFLALLEELGPEFGEAHLFRPYRDVRFSRDETLYKTHIAATVSPPDGGLLYVQFGADGLHVAGGLYRPARDQLERLRAAIADERSGPALERVLDAVVAAGFRIGGEQLKTVPRSYAKDAPRLDLLRRQWLSAHREHPPTNELSTPAALNVVRDDWRALAPLNEWLNRHVGPSRLPAERRSR